MDVSLAKVALPWVKRVWALLPPALRVPLLLAIAVGGVVLAVSSRGELRSLRDRDAAADTVGPAN